MYRYYAEIFGAQIDVLHYGPQMEFPLEEVIVELRNKPRVLFIANPNNPTGTLVPPSSLKNILEGAENTAVVIDEAYAEFSGVTLIPWINKYPNLFVARTFSKAAGLAALRLGAVIACADSASLLRRAMPPYPVNLAALVAAEAAVRDRQTIRGYVRETQRVRDWFETQLHGLGITTYPSSANFLLANFGPEGPQLFKKLERRGILLRERTKELGPGFVRITIGTQKEMLRLLQEIKRLG
jgi:histidinol-phosphate aminotransferase